MSALFALAVAVPAAEAVKMAATGATLAVAVFKVATQGRKAKK